MTSGNIASILIFLLGLMLVPGCNAPLDTAKVKSGDTIQVNYTVRLVDGTVVDSSVGQAPLEFTLGTDKMLPGFEKGILGMKVGETKTITIPANEAYGPYRDDLALEVPRELLAGTVTPQVGQKLQQKQEDGKVIVAIITKVTDKTVTLDANHPLAGQDLTFEIELVKIL